MHTTLQVQFVVLSDSGNCYEKIHRIGGFNSGGSRWLLSQEDAILWLELGQYRFFVVVGDVCEFVEVAENAEGIRYLKTSSDRDEPLGLLALPELAD
ncbi:DUF3892 domain-containing protein [Aureliella helgolandensis]|uniref:DUF3892 domain-containing protein n=1 Tax=Aureliella helgolandensis TaxID=2527968 RepID=A0A518GEJ7_9BACT|nr:DUF3892 domain-containing protein [Aureliella helgolandensis]QDV26978.1 hypothetical protein Q31a_53580 [Aureliella helgolandensis]